MKKIRHNPDFEPFALVIETEEEARQLYTSLQHTYVRLNGSSYQAEVGRLLSILDGPCDE